MDVHTEYASEYVRTCVETLLLMKAENNVGGPARTRAERRLPKAVAAYSSTLSFRLWRQRGFITRTMKASWQYCADYGCWKKETTLRSPVHCSHERSWYETKTTSSIRDCPQWRLHLASPWIHVPVFAKIESTVLIQYSITIRVSGRFRCCFGTAYPHHGDTWRPEVSYSADISLPLVAIAALSRGTIASRA